MEVLMHEASNGQGMNSAGSPVHVMEKEPIKHKLESKEINSETVRFMKTDTVDTIDIMFENITYTVSLGCRKGRKEILHGIGGRLPAKQLIALMGPSGAGKSTLLDVLSGYRITGVNGNVYINGRLRQMNSFRKCSAYITQDDRLEPLLTVIESMRVAADLKLPTKIPQYEKETIIEEILTTLGLYEHMNTRAGRLSGGQKKRLSIALELVNNPTVMFLDEPTTGLDSSSCMQVVNLLKLLARQGRTIVCTIHQPSASLFQLFDLVYVLAKGECLYHGTTSQLIPYLEDIKLPCPMYHNPADYIIELACGEYGEDKVSLLISGSEKGRSLQWFENRNDLLDGKALRALHPLKKNVDANGNSSLQATSLMHQIRILVARGFLMCKRDTTLTHLRIIVNVSVGFMLGSVFLETGMDGARVLENYNLLFSILIHHMMTTMMLTVVTFPMQMNILLKEHFNRWYSLKAFYTALTVVDLPISIFCCLAFTIIVYLITSQPLEIYRFLMFFFISLLVAFISQGTGLMIGAVFNVINGTFIGPTLSVPLMMFAGFGVSLRDIPSYLRWGTYVSFLRYGLEGFIGSIYGMDRPVLPCKEKNNLYCHYRYPAKFLSDIAMDAEQFWNDVIALVAILILTRVAAYLFLKWKIASMRNEKENKKLKKCEKCECANYNYSNVYSSYSKKLEKREEKDVPRKSTLRWDEKENKKLKKCERCECAIDYYSNVYSSHSKKLVKREEKDVPRKSTLRWDEKENKKLKKCERCECAIDYYSNVYSSHSKKLEIREEGDVPRKSTLSRQRTLSYVNKLGFRGISRQFKQFLSEGKNENRRSVYSIVPKLFTRPELNFTI